MKKTNNIYYYEFIQFLRDNYGGKLAKIGLSISSLCPNIPPCIFCNQKSFIPHSIRRKSISEQIKDSLPYLKSKYKTSRFIAYFQENTSTAVSNSVIKNAFNEISSYPEIEIIALSTRPDFISKNILQNIKINSQGKEIWIELGLQTTCNETLKKINRNHSFEDFLQAVKLIREFNFKIGVHMIIGLPFENDNIIKRSFLELAQCLPDYVKIHQLQVLKGTALEKLFISKKYTPLTLERYLHLTAQAIRILPSQTCIARILATSHPEDLIAPKWHISAAKFKQKLLNIMQEKNSF